VAFGSAGILHNHGLPSAACCRPRSCYGAALLDSTRQALPHDGIHKHAPCLACAVLATLKSALAARSLLPLAFFTGRTLFTGPAAAFDSPRGRIRELFPPSRAPPAFFSVVFGR